MASSVFLSAFAINAAVGGLVGSIGTAWLGLPQLFWISATIAAAGVVSLVVLNAVTPLDPSRRSRRAGKPVEPVVAPVCVPPADV
jgi:SET family sugar efflux transporter-like MFS transporter